MPTQVEAAPSARSWKSSAGYQVLWNGIIQSAAEPDFLIVFLFSISGLLFSLFLALSVKLTYDRGRKPGFRPEATLRRCSDCLPSGSFSNHHERCPMRRIGVSRIGAVAEVGEHGAAQRLGAA